MYNTRHYESNVQQGFRYRVLLATKSRRNHRQRASGQRGKVGDDASAASGSAIGYEAPLNTPRFHHINPFASYSNSTVAPVVFQRAFAYHRSQYSRYSAIYTDGSKRGDYVGCGVVIEDVTHGYRLTLLAAFSLGVAIYRHFGKHGLHEPGEP
ncbi:pggt1b [Trichonephila clavipes]|uniref:Pggt1b n=1 Tax=Trichonephila clavipes TaxID=2585209 RepID=A0A8X6WBZ9_TRICX|nr:pggt1b [Trichonephila clavipes]